MIKNRVFKPLLFMISFFMIIQCISTDVRGAYVKLQSGGRAKVLQIIDGDALKVQIVSTDEIALVRLAGIEALGFDDALTYMNNELLGHEVVLQPVSSAADTNGRWNTAFVYKENGVLINTELLERGFAKVSEGYSGSMSGTLTASEESGKARETGLWAPDDRYTYSYGLHYAGNGININTCTAEQITSRLTGVGSNTAANVVNYRGYNPFNTVSEIKFASGFSREMYRANRSLLTVCTNINTATDKELLTLKNFSQEDVDRILEFRSGRSFTSVYQLYGENLISYDKYNSNLPYIDIKDSEETYYAIPNRAANINTGSRSQLVNAGLSSSQADRIISGRGQYSYKNVGELAYMLSLSDISRLEDNLTTVTDINHAGIDEIRSLFGEGTYSSEADRLYNNRPYGSVAAARNYLSEGAYTAIEKYITTDRSRIGNTSYININTASMTQLKSVGMSDGLASALYNRSGSINEPRYIPTDISDYDMRLSMYTNINRAGYDEIASLLNVGDYSNGLINDLINERNEQPFGTMDELREFFENKGKSNQYYAVRSFIILR